MSNTALVKPGQQTGAIATFTDMVKHNKSALKQVAAENMDMSRLYRVIVGSLTRTPALRNCTADSILRAMMDAAEVGLEPGGALGLAYLVPYGRECQYIIGYRGFIELARRSGSVRGVEAYAVYDGDTFQYEQGLTPILRHVPGSQDHTPDKLTHVFAIARFKDSSAQADVMTRADVDRIRTRSKAGNNGPWVTDYEEMAKKTVVRRLCKYLPRSINAVMEKALALEDRQERGGFEMPAGLTMIDANAETPLDADITEGDDMDAHGNPEDE